MDPMDGSMDSNVSSMDSNVSSMDSMDSNKKVAKPKYALRSTKSYTLNKGKSLKKKLDATEEDKFRFRMKGGNNLVIHMTPAVFEIIREQVDNINWGQGWSTENEVRMDQQHSTVDRVIKLFRGDKKVCTFNLYYTTTKILINGPGTREFSNTMIPKIGALIHLNREEIEKYDQHLKNELQKALGEKERCRQKRFC